MHMGLLRCWVTPEVLLQWVMHTVTGCVLLCRYRLWGTSFGELKLMFVSHSYEMLISSTRSVLHGVILPLLSTMILCLAKSWPWILPSTQRGKSRTQQRSRAAVLSLNSMWMVSEPGDNRNWVHSWLLQTWVWMWLLNVYREMFTFQMKQFCKILRESTVTPWCGFVKEWEAEAVSEVCTLVPKAFFPNVLAVRRRAAGSFL